MPKMNLFTGIVTYYPNSSKDNEIFVLPSRLADEFLQQMLRFSEIFTLSDQLLRAARLLESVARSKAATVKRFYMQVTKIHC